MSHIGYKPHKENMVITREQDHRALVYNMKIIIKI